MHLPRSPVCWLHNSYEGVVPARWSCPCPALTWRAVRWRVLRQATVVGLPVGMGNDGGCLCAGTDHRRLERG